MVSNVDVEDKSVVESCATSLGQECLRHQSGCPLFKDCLTLRTLDSYPSKRRSSDRSPPSHCRALDTSAVPLLRLFVCLFGAQQPPLGHGLLIHEVSRSHTTMHLSR